MKISQSFIDNYLLVSGTVDNYLFENCEKDLLEEIIKLLRFNKTEKRQCIVCVTNDEEIKVLKLLDECQSSYERAILVRDFANAKVMRELYNGVDNKKLEVIDNHLNAFYRGDLWSVKTNHSDSTIFPYDIITFIKEQERVELNVFFEDIKSFEIQRAFNNYMSSRLPLSVKFFTNGKLASYSDQALNLIQSPHDFVSVNVSNFIEVDENEL